MVFGKRRLIIKELKEQVESLIRSNEELQKFAYITGIERSGRLNKFIFKRNGETVEIETVNLISDDLPGWKNKLLR